MIRVKWRERPENVWERPASMPKMIYELLLRRGIGSREEAEAFLNPAWEQVRDPFLLHDMDRCVARIRLAKERGERVCVYGDYDVDGVCATAILYRQMRKMGVDCDYYIPSRHQEGYGLNEAALRRIAEDHSLLVSLDCGITGAELVETAKALGLDCVITDHHTPSDTLPACPTVDPLLDGYPFGGLCGAGVAFKTALALRGEAAMEDIDLAALATVADVVSLTDENRAIVHLGLKKINADPRPGIRTLLKAAGCTKEVTSSVVAFQIAPRLNASGRMGDAVRALKLLMADTEQEAEPIAEELEKENRGRKGEEDRILKQVDAQMEGFDFVEHRAVVLAGEGWNPGVVGLAASRICERYGCPAIVLTRKGDQYEGSCRSIEGVNIHTALTLCAPLLTRFGGHKQAAGMAVAVDKLEDFRAALDDAIRRISDPVDFVPQVLCDMPLPVSELDVESLNILEKMEPTGMGNPAPLFSDEALVESAWTMGDGSHLKMKLLRDGKRVEAVWFGHGDKRAALTAETAGFVYSASVNRYMGRETVQCQIQRQLPAGEAEARFLDKKTQLQCSYLTNVLYNDNIIHSPCASVTREEAAALLAESPQGTLVIAFCEDAAALPNADIFVGAYPDDPRCFNAVCLCPVGNIPTGYRHVVLWDVPPELAKAGDLWTGRTAAGFRDLPDLDGMRQIYRQARAGIAPVTLREHAGMAVLEAAGLLESGWARSPRIRPSDKVDMGSCPAFKKLTCARERAERSDG